MAKRISTFAPKTRAALLAILIFTLLLAIFAAASCKNSGGLFGKRARASAGAAGGGGHEDSSGIAGEEGAGVGENGGLRELPGPAMERFVRIEKAIAEIESAVVPTEVDAGIFDTLRAELVRQLSERAAEYGGRIPAAAPLGDAGRVTDLAYDPETNLLTWSYVNKGDFDLSGDVGVPDITPIALNYLKLVEYDEDGNPAGDIETIDGYENHRLAWIDGDKSGEIGIPDITTIALNYLSDVLGYRIFRSPDGISEWEEFGSFVNFGVRGDFPKIFSIETTLVESVFVAVRPVGAGSTLGELSNVVRIDPAWNLASVALAGTSSGAGTESNPYVLLPNSSYPIIVLDSNANDVSQVCDYEPEFNYYRIVDTRYLGTLEFGPLSKVTVSRQGDPVSLEFWVKVWQ